jgi:hypothetical protein
MNEIIPDIATGLFSNTWLNWFMSSYSGMLAIAPIIITFLLKLLAIIDPKVPSDKIIALIQEYAVKKKDEVIK